MKQNVKIYVIYILLVTVSDFSLSESLNNVSSEVTRPQESDRLAVAKSNSIFIIPLLSSSVVTFKDLQMATVIQTSDYHAEVFSISYKDNLILYGKDSILAKPIG